MALRVLGLGAVLLAIAASAGAAPPGAPMVGGDSDAHGCKASAGYTYSALKKRCIRVWEDGIRLDPLKADSSATISAFVVFAKGHDGREAELMLPSNNGTHILKKTGKTWSGDGYRLTRKGSVFTVAGADGQPLYRGR
jgi:hypothetical protein